ncbi:intradiol ring-cleavage dioxygenase [Hyphobacterium sp. CCMP332]|nr:intradiol ring-cleavage dioxygenase [Hyphobacterium sp. CCMP332]
MKYGYLLLFFYLPLIGCESKTSHNENLVDQKSESQIHSAYDPTCEWCGANEAPLDIDWKTTIAGPDEEGERMIISGTVFMKDGKTPAKDVIVYVYHTNNEGVYPKRGDEKGNGKRHGYLRAWMKTNADGQYQFESIRPAAYQSHGGEPAHIHYVIKAPGQEEYWLDALIFSDDPRSTGVHLNSDRNGGFSHITDMKRDENGVWIGNRDILIQDF